MAHAVDFSSESGGDSDADSAESEIQRISLALRMHETQQPYNIVRCPKTKPR